MPIVQVDNGEARVAWCAILGLNLCLSKLPIVVFTCINSPLNW